MAALSDTDIALSPRGDRARGGTLIEDGAGLTALGPLSFERDVIAMKRFRMAGVLVAVLAILGMSPAAGASGSGQYVPFKSTVSGQVQFLPATDCPIGLATTMVDVPGLASHLGVVTTSSRHCTPTGDAFGPGTMTIVAANGDKLFATYTGSAPFPGPGVEVVVATSHSTIVGGTGRFQDAEGYVDTTSTIQFEGFGDPSWPITQVSTGMIHY